MRNKFIAILIVLILILPTYAFFLGDKMFTFHDETQIANLHQYFKAIDLGQFPPRFATDVHFEYGSPFLSFNYQLPYYLGYLGHLAGFSLTTIFKSLLAVSFVVGAVGMFFLGLSLTNSSFIAIFAAVLYSYTPFQSIDHFVRGSLGESFALSLFPWLFLVSFLLVKKVNNIRIIFLGILFALLIISHQPAAVFAIPLFLFIFGFVIPKTYIKSLIVAALLSAYYVAPIFLERKYVIENSPFNFHDQFPFIRQLIYSSWSYLGANPFSSDTMSFQIGLVNLAILIVAVIYSVFWFRGEKDRSFRKIFASLLATVFVVIFLMNIRSSFIWRAIPLIQLVQFPWRLLMFTTILTPVIFLIMARQLKGKWSSVIISILLVVSIGLNLGYFHPGEIYDRPDSYYLHRFLPRVALVNGEKISSAYLTHAEDYITLPKGAVRPINLPSAKLTSNELSTKITVIDPNPYRFRAEVITQKGDSLTFHTFFYPGWSAIVDSYATVISSDEIGAITIPVPSGKHQVVVFFQDTPLRLFSNIISLGTLVFSTTYLIYQLVNHHAASTARSANSNRGST